MPSYKIALLAGGVSAEKEISTRSGQNLYKALKEAGFDTTLFDPIDFGFNVQELKKFDIVYPILHGTKGEDGCIQGLLESYNIPYTGSNIMASSLTMDKGMTKKVFQAIDIPCARGFVTGSNLKENLQKIDYIGYPVFIKPSSEGSSVGTLILHSKQEAKELLENHLEKYPSCLVEELLVGREMTVGIVEYQKQVKVLPILELKSKKEFYDYEAKYTAGMTEFIIPATIDDQLLKQITNDALKIFEEFQLRDCVRIDLILTKNGPKYLEINTAPGMTHTSDIPAMLKVANISMSDFVTNIVNNAKERFSCT